MFRNLIDMWLWAGHW